MVKVFIPPNEIKDLRYLPILYPNFGVLVNENRLFADRGKRSVRLPVVEIINDAAAADFFLLPYEYFDIVKKYPVYLEESLALARRSGKKLLIFDLSDYTDISIDLPDAWVFRIADYASRKRKNVIVIPTFIEDLGAAGVPAPRVKGETPIVGFCGWAGFRNFLTRAKFALKELLFSLRIIFERTPRLEARHKGIYFRIKALKALARSAMVKTNFIIRRSYSSHINTIEKTPEELRREYIENISDSDLALAVRGDANISCRFYEILSLGRVPFFVDTDCVLPLAEEIDYREFVVFADHTEISKLGEIAADFWKRTSAEEFVAMQKAARAAFEKYLNIEAFLNHILPKLAERERVQKNR